MLYWDLNGSLPDARTSRVAAYNLGALEPRGTMWHRSSASGSRVMRGFSANK
jgi:hypothetical protein